MRNYYTRKERWEELLKLADAGALTYRQIMIYAIKKKILAAPYDYTWDDIANRFMMPRNTIVKVYYKANNRLKYSKIFN